MLPCSYRYLGNASYGTAMAKPGHRPGYGLPMGIWIEFVNQILLQRLGKGIHVTMHLASGNISGAGHSVLRTKYLVVGS